MTQPLDAASNAIGDAPDAHPTASAHDATPGYKPGKTARRTARRREREAAERAAALAAVQAGQAEGTDGEGATGELGAGRVPVNLAAQHPILVQDEDTIGNLEEGEEDDEFNVMIPLPLRIETAAAAFVKKGKKRKITPRQLTLLRAFLRHGGIKLQKPVNPTTEKAKKKAEELVELDDIPSMDPDRVVFPEEEDEDDGEEIDAYELGQQKVIDSDPESDFGDDEDDDDEDKDDEDMEGVRQVDFFGVTCSFLSCYMMGPESQFVEMDDVKEAPRVCASFLRYLLLRKAAPEFDSEIQRCVELCEQQATRELPLCKELSCLLPGKFNMACSIRFGGEYHRWLDLTALDAETAAEEEREGGRGKVTSLDGVKIFDAPSMNQANSDQKEIKGWGPEPPAPDPKQKKRREPTLIIEDWEQEGETESVLGVTRSEVIKYTSRFYPLKLAPAVAEKDLEKNGEKSTADADQEGDEPKPERFYTLARITHIPSQGGDSGPGQRNGKQPQQQTDHDDDTTGNYVASTTFLPVKFRFVESAEDQDYLDDYENGASTNTPDVTAPRQPYDNFYQNTQPLLTAEVYLDLLTTQRLVRGMLVEGSFYRLPNGHWYIGQVAFVLPSYTQDDLEE